MSTAAATNPAAAPPASPVAPGADQPPRAAARAPSEGPLSQLIPLAKIEPSKTNPRKTFDKAGLDELTESIRKVGILQPVLVRPIAGTGRYELVAGERRYRAARAASLEAIPATVRELSDTEVLEIQLVENLQRSDLHPLEEAEGYRQLMARKYDVARIAERVGRSIKYVYDRVKLLTLTPEAKEAFRQGRFTAGHAILLARLSPQDQKRAMTLNALFANESLELLWDPVERKRPSKKDDLVGGLPDDWKPVSVREFDAWINKYVRFDTGAPDPMLFPETTETLKTSQEKAEKIIPITYLYQVPEEARTEGRTWTERSWKRADGQQGSKPCPRSVTGVVVIGPHRGEAFKVCVNKDNCEIHWGKEKREKEKRARATTSGSTEQDRWQRENEERRRDAEREDAQRKRWEKACPTILKALAEKVKVAPVRAQGFLAQLVLQACRGHAAAQAYVPLGKTAEDLVRHAAFFVLCREADAWTAYREFPKRAKAFGLDVAKIVDGVAPPKTAKPS